MSPAPPHLPSLSSEAQAEPSSSQSPQPVFTLSAGADQSNILETQVLKQENADLKRENADLRAAVAREQADKLSLWHRFDSLESKFESFLSSQKSDTTTTVSLGGESLPLSPASSASISQPSLAQEPVAQPLVARERSSLPRKPTSSCPNGSTILQPQRQRPTHLRPPAPSGTATPSSLRPPPLSNLLQTLSSAQQKQVARMLAHLISRRQPPLRPTSARTSTFLASSHPTRPLQQPLTLPSGLRLWIHPRPSGTRQNKKAFNPSQRFVFKQ